ncbi:protein disulfide-isomerase precursor [Coniothyrium glycines]
MLSLGDGRFVKHDHGWSTPSILRSVKNMYGPAVVGLQQLSSHDTVGPDFTHIVAFISEEDHESHQVFADVAEKWRGRFSFAFTANASIITAQDASKPSLIVAMPSMNSNTVYDGPFSFEDIENFLQTATKPLIEEIDPGVYDQYVDVGKPLAYILFDDVLEIQSLSKSLYSFADKVKHRMSFVTVNTNDYPARGQMLGLAQELKKGFAIEDVITTRTYPMANAELSVDSIVNFASQYLAGKLQPTIRSEEALEQSSQAPLLTLVGQNFEEYAFDKSRDVLVEFFVPDCDYCIGLHEQMEQLGKRYLELGYSGKVALAKIDVSTNDVPIRITGYPSLRLFRAGDNAVVDFDGTYHEMLTEDQIASFLRNHGFHGVSLPSEANVGIGSLPDSSSHEQIIHQEL